MRERFLMNISGKLPNIYTYIMIIYFICFSTISTLAIQYLHVVTPVWLMFSMVMLCTHSNKGLHNESPNCWIIKKNICYVGGRRMNYGVLQPEDKNCSVVPLTTVNQKCNFISHNYRFVIVIGFFLLFVFVFLAEMGFHMCDFAFS